LAHIGILEYGDNIKNFITNKFVLAHGGSHEIEIRANTVVAVEKLKNELNKLDVKYNSVEIDWLLWQKGEEQKKDIIPHHRTLSIFY